MAKWVFDQWDNVMEYPTLGFVAEPGDILDAVYAPDARWSLNADQGAVETVHRFALGSDPDYIEPTDGHVLTYSATQNTYVPTAPGAVGLTSVDAYVADKINNDPTSQIKTALSGTYAAKLGGVVQSKALASGSNQSTVLQAEADALETFGGGTLQLPAGTIVGSVAIASDVAIVGAGVGATILKAPASHAGGVIQSKGFATYTGTTALSPETRGAHRVQIFNLTVDGNKANAAGSVGIQIYGAGWRMGEIRVQNCGGDGIYTEFGSDVNFSTFNALEGYADNIMTCGNGGNGWTFRGPHDSNINNLVSHSNAGWGFRNETLALKYNGALGHCSRFNMFLNANGWYVGDGVASYTGGQSAGASGVGLEFKAGIGSVILHGLLVAGWTTGAILRGSCHDVSLLVQRNVTGVRIDGISGSSVRLTGEGNTTAAINVVGEGSSNQYFGHFNVSGGATLLAAGSAPFNASTHVLISQVNANPLWQVPDVFSLPSSEVRSSRTIASTADLMAARNTASQITLGQFVYEGRGGVNFSNDAFIGRDGAKRIGVPADHVIRTGRAVTGSRPSASTAGAGASFYDTTLGKPIWSDGTVWRDAAGTAV